MQYQESPLSLSEEHDLQLVYSTRCWHCCGVPLAMPPPPPFNHQPCPLDPPPPITFRNVQYNHASTSSCHAAGLQMSWQDGGKLAGAGAAAASGIGIEIGMGMRMGMGMAMVMGMGIGSQEQHDGRDCQLDELSRLHANIFSITELQLFWFTSRCITINSHTRTQKVELANKS